MVAETAKLLTEAWRMRLSNVLDTFRLVLTAMAATAAVVVALNQIGLMFERYEQVSENFRMERTWWVVVKYGVGASLLGIVPTVIVFWLWIL